MLYIVTRLVEQGRVAGLVSGLGIHAATLVHVLAAALGLSALLVRTRYARLFGDGFIVNLFNPKTALFFLAFCGSSST